MAPPSRTLRIALVQQPASDDLNANLEQALAAIDDAAAAGAQVVCFAELGLSPFYPQRSVTRAPLELAESIPGPTTDRIAACAARHGVVVIPNLYEREGDKAYDTSAVLGPDGSLLGRTRMVHITDFACFHEKGYYSSGEDPPKVFETPFGRLAVVICYDRHYPESFRAAALGGAEVVFVPQAGAVDEWPPGVFEAEIQTAALQNGLFVALCNRVGREEQVEFAGESFVCGPSGAVLARAPRGERALLLCDLELDTLVGSPARRLFLADRRPDLYAAWRAGSPELE